MKSDLDLVVVGAGPAGVSAAITAARAGARVACIDKATFPRDKTCGDGLTTAALRNLEKLGFDPHCVPSFRIVRDTTWRSPSGHTIRLEVPDDGLRIAVARRQELDAALVELARSNGVTVHEGHGLENVVDSGTSITVEAKGLGAMTAPYVIGADGMWSPLRHCIEPRRQSYLGEIHAFRQYFTNVTGVAAEQLWVSFEPDLLPGYVWSFPVGKRCANVGFGIERHANKTVSWMKGAWEDILQRPHVRQALGEGARPESPHRAWPIPAGIYGARLSAADGRVLFVGDAARAVDPLTGEGIAQALETGERAVKALLHAGKHRPSLAERRYKRAVRLGMSIDHRFSRSLAEIVRHDRGARAVIRLAPAGPWHGQYAIRWVFEDNPRAGLLTPWRWKKRFRSKGGAYRSVA